MEEIKYLCEFFFDDFALPEDRVLIAKVENVLYERLVELEKKFDEL